MARVLWQNRRQRKELGRRLRSEDPGLQVIHPNAAGIDVGNRTHYVAVRPDKDAEPVRRFACFTADLHRLADWLHRCGVETVAMQSTGVYWIPVYEIVEARGFEVYLVNARHTKNLPGRKTDVQESQWLLKLHTYGLLGNSFRPTADIRILRTYWRQRGEHVQAAATCIQRMQKVLTQMNIQLANVISDLSGWTGQTILRAIIDGERDPYHRAALADYRVQASPDEIARSLHGTWQPELLFLLKPHVDMYDTHQRWIHECDQELERHLTTFADKVPVTRPNASPPAASDRLQGSSRKRSKKAHSHPPHFDLRHELSRMSGVDLTQIDGIDVSVAQTVISEVGLDMSRWADEHHFASWLGLCPHNKTSGSKVLGRATRPVVNRATTALRLAATTLVRSRSYLGAQYRRFRTRLGAPKAITAMAHTLAVLVYRMLKFGQEYVDKGMQYYEDKHRQQQIRLLKQKAARLGLQIVQPDAA